MRDIREAKGDEVSGRTKVVSINPEIEPETSRDIEDVGLIRPRTNLKPSAAPHRSHLSGEETDPLVPGMVPPAAKKISHSELGTHRIEVSQTR